MARPFAHTLVSAPAFTITFLGTGSGVPSLDRNLACVAVQRQGELFLFDCGEAAQIQYRRAGLGFAPLRAIFISHLHGDHITGLMGLLMSLQMADRHEPLDLYGPPGLGEY
ncbi:MAG TPA: MBL fold metallo-hydrolase, partial [Armatimonadota bacterium]|nr:MBL fold metallo-hydrolase [Armatimonadota bacterium]